MACTQEQASLVFTVFLGVLDELHDDGVAVGQRHARARELGVEAD